MASTNILDTLLGPSVNGSESGGLFYQPIKETGDLIKATNLLGRDGVRLPELYIAPPTRPLGALPMKVLDELEKTLVLANVPTADEVVRMEIDELLTKYGGGDPEAKNVLLADMEQAGLTGALNSAAVKLNQSRLSTVERSILSRHSLAMYAFFRATIGMDVDDVEGITTNVLSSLRKIYSYMNRELVVLVLESHNLKADPTEVKVLQDRLAEREIPYEGTQATRAILDEYLHVVGQAELIEACNEFLDSGLVDIPPHLNREEIIKEMIEFLQENGFDPKAVSALNPTIEVEANGLDVQFKGSTSDDADVVAWLWDFGDGNTANYQNPIHRYSTAGKYSITLTVTETNGDIESADLDLDVSSTGKPPEVEIQYRTAGSKVYVEGVPASLSQIDTWCWRFGDGGTADTQQAEHDYATSGRYTITLEVIDSAGRPGKATVDVELSMTYPPGLKKRGNKKVAVSK